SKLGSRLSAASSGRMTTMTTTQADDLCNRIARVIRDDDDPSDVFNALGDLYTFQMSLLPCPHCRRPPVLSSNRSPICCAPPIAKQQSTRAPVSSHTHATKSLISHGGPGPRAKTPTSDAARLPLQYLRVIPIPRRQKKAAVARNSTPS